MKTTGKNNNETRRMRNLSMGLGKTHLKKAVLVLLVVAVSATGYIVVRFLSVVGEVVAGEGLSLAGKIFVGWWSVRIAYKLLKVLAYLLAVALAFMALSNL